MSIIYYFTDDWEASNALASKEFYQQNIIDISCVKYYSTFVDSYYLLETQFYSEDEIIEIIDLVKYQQNFTDYILKYSDKFSESFILRYFRYFDLKFWEYYPFSKNFIMNNLDKINFNLLKDNENVDQEFIEKLELLK